MSQEANSCSASPQKWHRPVQIANRVPEDRNGRPCRSRAAVTDGVLPALVAEDAIEVADADAETELPEGLGLFVG